MIREENDRRWKLVYITPNDILSLFIPWSQVRDGETFAQLILDPAEFPEGYKIDEVAYDGQFQGWRLLIHHPSFDIVPPLKLPPQLVRGHMAFFPPLFRSAEEAHKAATWMYKTEANRLREMLSDLDLEGSRVK